jgi:hypothetical protein
MGRVLSQMLCSPSIRGQHNLVMSFDLYINLARFEVHELFAA